MKYALIPFAVISPVIIDSIISKAHAESFKLSMPKLQLPEINLNPFQPIIDMFRPIADFFNGIISFFQNLPRNIANWSIEFMSTVYEFTSKLIMKTPLWIFDNQWFHNTTYKFSFLTIGIVSALAAFEGIKHMVKKWRKKKEPPMDMIKIGKRWSIASVAMLITPFLYQKIFQVLNWISDFLISIGGQNMKGLTIADKISFFDVLTLLVFNLILLGTVIPVLWKNARRFFDILVLTVSTPFALTAWIFDSYRHLFNQWLDNLIHLSLVQLYYAFYLLILGLFLFGTPTPDDLVGIIIKVLVVIGAYARMIDPPRIIRRHLDTGDGLDESIRNTKEVYEQTRRNYQASKKPFSAVRRAYNFLNPKPQVVSNPMSRRTRRR